MKGALRSVVRKSKVHVNLRRLRRVRDPVASQLATSITGTIEHKIAPEERALIDRIESKRMALIDSDDDLKIIDFGTGEDPSRSAAALHGTGVVSKRPLSQLAGKTSKPPFWAVLLFKIIREFRPSTCIELATCLGISAAYQASAQRLNQKGKLITLEGSESLASLAIPNLQELALENTQVVVGRFIDSLDAVLEESKPIDYVFIDGHHDEKATVAHFEHILPYLAEESIMIFDDISLESRHEAGVGLHRGKRPCEALSRFAHDRNLRSWTQTRWQTGIRDPALCPKTDIRQMIRRRKSDSTTLDRLT